ncbi:hypothetical protein, partial [Marinobacter pelagius]|uniref:hypothetical protein n=1 Tax=Marinobacter pelagius TaxID=379482 RepID=UPI001C68BE68
ARLKTYGALFGDKNHKAFSRFCLCGHEKSGLRAYSSHFLRAFGPVLVRFYSLIYSYFSVSDRNSDYMIVL